MPVWYTIGIVTSRAINLSMEYNLELLFDSIFSLECLDVVLQAYILIFLKSDYEGKG